MMSGHQQQHEAKRPLFIAVYESLFNVRTTLLPLSMHTPHSLLMVLMVMV
jgi:hypothetical protein